MFNYQIHLPAYTPSLLPTLVPTWKVCGKKPWKWVSVTDMNKQDGEPARSATMAAPALFLPRSTQTPSLPLMQRTRTLAALEQPRVELPSLGWLANRVGRFGRLRQSMFLLWHRVRLEEEGTHSTRFQCISIVHPMIELSLEVRSLSPKFWLADE